MLRFIAIFFIFSPLLAQAKWEDTSALLNQLLDSSKYDRRIRPVGPRAEPTNVTINMYIRSIEYICSVKMEYKTQITFRQEWNDPRLKFNDQRGNINYLTLTETDRIWLPDIFIANSKKTEVMSDIKPNVLIRIYPNGNVLYSTRFTTLLSCPMDLYYYPFDRQVCSIQLASYGFTTDDLIFKWKGDNYNTNLFVYKRPSNQTVSKGQTSPIQVTKSLNIAGFTLEKYLTTYCTSRTNTGEYSCLKADFVFVRQPYKYIIEWFIPMAVLTVISFASFWMKPKACRVKLLLFVLLLVYLQTLYINNKANIKVSYSTLKDCWSTSCMIFVIAALAELMVVKLVHCLTTRNKQGHHHDDLEKSLTSERWIKDERTIVEKVRALLITQVIDLTAAIIFPVAFIIYMIIFFTKYQHRNFD